jgi:hypothetical protein
MGNTAFIDGMVYMGDGEVIDRGFVVWRGPTIEEVGAMTDFAPRSGLDVVDLRGSLLLPGLVDSHIHLVGYALSLIRIDLARTRSLEEGLGMVASRAAGLAKGDWLIGRGWDKQRWGLEGFPDREMLDRAAPGTPVSLTSRDGHLVWVNSAALRLLDLDRQGIAVEGGEVEKDARGRPTGIFKEKATGLVQNRLGQEDQKSVESALKLASDRLLNLGLTGVHSSEDGKKSGLLGHALGEGAVALRVTRMREIGETADIDNLTSPAETPFVKILADGTLGSQTASMLEPYCGQSENLGIAAVPKPKLRQMVLASVGRGFSVAVHAIGDRANMEVLDVYEEARKAYPDRGAVLRVEHVQVIRPEDIPRFRELDAVASMQPIHLVSDMEVADRYWGKRSRFAYAFRSILRAGGTLAFGSDAPIEDPDPLRGIHAAVTRQGTRDGTSPPWHPGERISISQAIDAYTTGAAKAAGLHDTTGSIRPGMRADLTVLGRNVLSLPDPLEILDTRATMTVVDGRIYPSA